MLSIQSYSIPEYHFENIGIISSSQAYSCKIYRPGSENELRYLLKSQSLSFGDPPQHPPLNQLTAGTHPIPKSSIRHCLFMSKLSFLCDEESTYDQNTRFRRCWLREPRDVVIYSGGKRLSAEETSQYFHLISRFPCTTFDCLLEMPQIAFASSRSFHNEAWKAGFLISRLFDCKIFVCVRNL